MVEDLTKQRGSLIISIMHSFWLGLDNNALALNNKTNKLQNVHRKPVLTLHLYNNGQINLVGHKLLRRASISKSQIICDLQVISEGLFIG